MSGGSSLKDTDFSNDTDLSGIDVDQRIFVIRCRLGFVKRESVRARDKDFKTETEDVLNVQARFVTRMCAELFLCRTKDSAVRMGRKRNTRIKITFE